MALQFAVEVRNGRLDAIESVIGASPVLRIRTGPPPANVAAADTGTILAEMVLPADYLAAAANGTKPMAGTWTTTGLAIGDAAHFRIHTAGGAARMQGTVGESAADMLIDNKAIKVGQTVTVRTFTLTDANA